MTDDPTFQAPADLETRAPDDGPEMITHEPAEPTHTGVPAVDEVVADVDRLDGAPLEEHLPAFERAHEALRSALDADPGEPA
jgi:hypothetical protein